MIPEEIWRMLERQAVIRARSRAWANTGNRIAARMAIMAITTSNSIRVKPVFRPLDIVLPFPRVPARLISSCHESAKEAKARKKRKREKDHQEKGQGRSQQSTRQLRVAGRSSCSPSPFALSIPSRWAGPFSVGPHPPAPLPILGEGGPVSGA